MLTLFSGRSRSIGQADRTKRLLSKRRNVMSKFTFIAGLLLCSMAPMIHGQVQCSTANLRGLYSFVASGTLGGQPFATAGQTMYEGNGNVSGLIQISLNGNVTPLLKWTGTYTIDPETCVVNKEAVIPGIGKVHFVV